MVRGQLRDVGASSSGERKAAGSYSEVHQQWQDKGDLKVDPLFMYEGCFKTLKLTNARSPLYYQIIIFLCVDGDICVRGSALGRAHGQEDASLGSLGPGADSV